MGILTIQFGQCGNQIGHSLFNFLSKDITAKKQHPSITKSAYSDYVDASKRLWFSKTDDSFFTPRSILVDTEIKVVTNILRSRDSLRFRNVLAKSDGGSANNWAFGYTKKGNDFVEEVRDIVRREIERSDEILSFVGLMGSGGGTGSGTGSYVLECLRDEYPNSKILSVIVLPYQNGEIVTQNYNTLLTLAKLYNVTNGCILFENDKIHNMCKNLLSIKYVDLQHMNAVIAQKLASVLQPAPGYSVCDFVSQLTSHPGYKFIKIKSTPHINKEHTQYEPDYEWSVLMEHIRKSMYCNRSIVAREMQHSIRRCISVGSLLISRGGTSADAKSRENLVKQGFYAPWLPASCATRYFHQPISLGGVEKFLTFATNDNRIALRLNDILGNCWTLYNHKAYLYQYEKHGIDESQFETAFETLEGVLSNYKSL